MAHQFKCGREAGVPKAWAPGCAPSCFPLPIVKPLLATGQVAVGHAWSAAKHALAMQGPLRAAHGYARWLAQGLFDVDAEELKKLEEAAAGFFGSLVEDVGRALAQVAISLLKQCLISSFLH